MQKVLSAGVINALNSQLDVPGIGGGSQLENDLESALGNAPGNVWFVNSVTGNDANAGTNWASAFKTLADVFSVAASSDTIYMTGTFTETAITTSLNNLTVIGAGPTPDSNIWMEGSAGITLLTLTGINNLFYNTVGTTERACGEMKQPAFLPTNLCETGIRLL